jgi:hypothetical protein
MLQNGRGDLLSEVPAISSSTRYLQVIDYIHLETKATRVCRQLVIRKKVIDTVEWL